jgi:hypothetical protein
MYRPQLLVILGYFLYSQNNFASIPEKYQTIVDRNPFALNPLPPAVENPVLAPPPIDIKLTGFTQTTGGRKAYFVIQPKDGKAAVRYVNLTEGEKDDFLEVVKISENEGEVRIRNSGVESVLTLKNDTLKTMPGSLASAQPTSTPVVANQVSQASDSSPPQRMATSTVYIPDSSRNRFGSSGSRGNSTTTFSSAPATFASNPGVSNLGAAPSPQVNFNSANNSSSSVVFHPTLPSSANNNTSQTVEQVEPAAQYLNMTLQHEIGKRKGIAIPPPPPMPR